MRVPQYWVPLAVWEEENAELQLESEPGKAPTGTEAPHKNHLSFSDTNVDFYPCVHYSQASKQFLVSLRSTMGWLGMEPSGMGIAQGGAGPSGR